MDKLKEIKNFEIVKGIVMDDLAKVGDYSYFYIQNQLGNYLELLQGKNISLKIEILND